MAGKVSAEMKRARELVEGGQTPYAAASASGVTRQAIYMSHWYKERKRCQLAERGNIATK